MSTLTDPSIAPAPPATGTPPRGPNGWLVIGGVLTALVLATGTLTAAGWLGYRSATEHETYRMEVTDISIELDTGDVTLEPGEPGSIAVTRRITWSYQRPDIQEHWDGRSLRITSDCALWHLTGPHCGVSYTLRVPADAAVQARTSTGDITIRDMRGALRLSSSTGDIRVTGAGGELQLNSSTGNLVASAITSPTVEASTGAGDVRLTFTAAPHAVSARASTGDIEIVVPQGQSYRVQADSGIGDERITVRRDEGAQRTIVARTSTGDIDIRYG